MNKFLFLLVLFSLTMANFAQGNMNTNKSSSVSIETVVNDLETKFKVSVTYEHNINVEISNQHAKDVIDSKNIDLALTKLSDNNNLKYEKLRSDYYVLVSKDSDINEAIIKTSTAIAPADDKITITGVISDDEDKPLPGATIYVKSDNSYHAITDVYGKYTIIVPKDAKFLVISYVGFEKKTIKIDGRTKINVSMSSDSKELEAVVVSGVAGKTSVKKLTVTVAHVDEETLKRVPATSAASALQGKVPGVSVKSTSGQPGSGSNIQLRGATSLLGNNSPLVIVDGIMVQTSLADMNSDDIESIEVVKGAAASALYGSKAAGGVIVITTKRGSKGKDSYEIIVRNEFGSSSLAKNIEQATHHPYKLDSNYSDYGYTRYDNVVYDSDGKVVSGSRSLTDSAYSDQPYGKLYDNQEKFFKNGNFYTNFIGVATTAKSSNLYFSFENHHNEGIIYATDGYTRRNFRFNSDTKIGKRLKFSTSNLYITSSSDKPGSNSSFHDLLFVNPDVDLEEVDKDGLLLVAPDPWSIDENPLYPLSYRERSENKSTFMSSLSAKVYIFDWINWETQYSFEHFSKTYETYTPKGYEYGGGASIDGSLYNSQYTANNQTFQTTLNFNKVYNDFLFKGKLSYLYEDNNYESFSVTGRDFIVPGIPQLTNTDPTKASLSSYDGIIRAINYFGILDVDYKGKYLFSGLYRRDGSSLFGENNRWANYYRFAAAYRITEDFKIPHVKELKIRAAIGTSGLRPGYSWQYETYYTSNGKVYRDQLGNKDLRPSEAREIEIAIDAFFLKRFNFTMSYSNTKTTGAFAKVPLASHLGYPSQWRNVGDMSSDVFEVSLGVNAIKQKDSRLHFQLNFDKITQKLTALTIPPYYTGPHSAYYLKPGEEFGVIYGYKWLTSLDQMAQQLPTGKTIDDYQINSDGYVIEKGTEGSTIEKTIALDENNDGTPDKVAIGNGNADFRMSLSTIYTYKGFTFYMLLDWKQGGDIYNYTHQYTFRDGRAIEFDQSGKEQSDKKSNAYYSNFYQQSINDYFVENGTYLKLRELSLYYTISPKILKGYVKEIKFGVVGRNLLTFTSYTGYDPDVASSGDLTTFAFDNFSYPNFRTISASLQFKF